MICDSRTSLGTPTTGYKGRYHFDYCVDWIADQLDEAAKDLPASRITAENGRMTSTICKAIKTYHSITGNKVGIKIAGGVRTAEDAVRYYTIVKEILGDEWLNKDLFRIGASSLVGDIEKRLSA